MTPNISAQCGLILLAGGASTRMGEPKQLLVVGGKPMLVRAVEAALAAPVWPVVVVLGAQAERIRPAVARFPILVAENPTWAEGMASSLRTGIATLQSFSRAIDSAIIALCDQPAFSSDVITRLLDCHRETGCGIVAAHYGGHLGAPMFFTRDYFAALAALSGDEGARKLVAAADPVSVASVELPDLAEDLDTPEDYARVRGL